MNKHKNVLIVLIAALLLITCYGGCSRHTDNTITSVSQSTSEVAKDERETKVIDASETDTTGESTVSEESAATKPSEEDTDSEASTEVSLEGSTSEETQGSTKPEETTAVKPSNSSSGSTKPSGSTKTTEAATKVQTTTKATVQPTTAASKPTQAPAQPTTAASKPTQAPAQPTTAAPKPTQAPTQAPTEAPTQAKPAYNPDYVIAETTRQLKAAGYTYIPDGLKEALANGTLSQADYDKFSTMDEQYYSWFEHSLYNVTFGLTMEDDIYELVEGCKYLCVSNIFYIEYIGENEYGGYTFRVYR